MGYKFADPAGFGAAAGLIVGCVAAHSVFPEMYGSMATQDRKHFDKAINAGFLGATLFYALFAALAYYFYGECTLDCITLNLMQSSPSLGRIATIGVLVSAFMTGPTMAAPVIRILSEILLLPRTGQPRAEHDCRGTALLKVLLLVVTACLAIFVPSFGFIAGMLGSTVGTLLVFILPPAFYVSVHWQTLSSQKRGLFVAMVVAGCGTMVAAVQSTLGLQ